ncbi:MAG: UDP-N-acetylglucosamine--N-acetylmuramyl-(pentapeptide) pyrophosphoryl-undecaprenol N-acetylglucosamine transferase [Candidatus Saccharibacteria bacterium]|nr:UDP-N-acetylglucosamine--N-acetylmuramyl-(pentapeptide) pyrophosphoryl-undecaprenol N-acetylglucosamine transferase [Candidatus Saccharibacteria bacterium]
MKKIKILTVGGGSGGHIIPVKAVIDELLAKDHQLQIEFWCDRKSLKMARAVFAKSQVKISPVIAGKFRRYHHFKWWQHLRPSILIPNMIDLFKFAIGFFQSIIKLLLLRPDIVFAKGGFVCLPVGLAAHSLGIKLITHDSDTVAGLTNRILAKYAVKITTGMPVEYYNYPITKTTYLGIPTLKNNGARTNKQDLNLPKNKKVVLISGGGLGSELLNHLTMDSLPKLNSNIFVVLVAGKIGFERLNRQKIPEDKLRLLEFVSNFNQYIEAADVVVTRAGATTLAEMANVGKALILVPNRKLVGGHQLKNARILEERQAAIVLNELDLEKQSILFADTINQLIDNPEQQAHLRQNIKAISKPYAAKKLAEIILAEIKNV